MDLSQISKKQLGATGGSEREARGELGKDGTLPGRIAALGARCLTYFASERAFKGVRVPENQDKSALQTKERTASKYAEAEQQQTPWRGKGFWR